MTHPDGTPMTGADTPLVRAVRGEVVDGQEALVVRADGTRHAIMMHARPLHHRDGHIIGGVGSSYNITALREREAELAAFAGIVAHDLKSPLTAIGGYTEMVRDDLAHRGDTEQAQILDRVLAGTDRMRRLIDDLLGYAAARDGALDTVRVDLRTLVDDVITERLAALTASTGGTADARPQIFVGALPTVHADPAMLRQLLDNLIGNALKYTPPGHTARLDITAHPDSTDWVRVEVADRGIGIPHGQHDAIFAGFHRAHRSAGYTGTGLGLAICHRVITRHGGTITATDNPGGGARFTFTLPNTPTNHTIAPTASPAAAVSR